LRVAISASETFYALGVKVRIDFAADRKTFFRRGVGDQGDHDI